MSGRTEIRAPTRRICEQCGRREGWDVEQQSWMIERESGERLTGDPYCIHEWDINGSFSPYG